MRFAARMSRLGTETAFEVNARARQLRDTGVDVIHLEIGEPDFDTPSHVIEAGVNAMRSGATHYSPAAGIHELREAIVNEMKRSRGLTVDTANVVVTPGGKPIMFFVMLALLDSGDSVAYPNPGFPIYESMAEFLGARCLPIGFNEIDGRFVFDVDQLVSQVDESTKLIILNSPSNPTGAVLSRDDLSRIAETARRVDAVVLSDEIYGRIQYEGNHESIACLPGMQKRTVVLDGFSKTYAMTGWRLGYGVMPEELAVGVTRLMVNSNSCTATFSQMAAVEALRGSQVEAESMVNEFRRRRDIIVNGLNDIEGISCAVPSGAFYAFPNISGLGVSSREAADRLLHDGGVATLAGTSFGANGEGHLRLSYANSYQNIERALERIATTFAHTPAPV